MCGQVYDQLRVSVLPGVRPDAAPALGDLNGQLRQRRRLLSLLVLSGPRLRQNHPCGHLRAR